MGSIPADLRLKKKLWKGESEKRHQKMALHICARSKNLTTLDHKFFLKQTFIEGTSKTQLLTKFKVSVCKNGIVICEGFSQNVL